MTAITFTLKNNPTFKLDCSRLTPNNLTGLSIEQIKNLKLLYSKNSPKVSDFFDVSGDDTKQKSDEAAKNILFKNSSSLLDYIGHKMTQGQITIETDCGDFLGANMQGGNIVCSGNAGDRVCVPAGMGDISRRHPVALCVCPLCRQARRSLEMS